MMNIGYRIARSMFDFDCVVFHDVDMLTEDDRNFYTCADQPRHAGAYIDKYKYRSVLIIVLDTTRLDRNTICHLGAYAKCKTADGDQVVRKYNVNQSLHKHQYKNRRKIV